MAHPNLLDQKTTALVVVDIQEAFRNVIPDFTVVASRASTAVQGCQILDVPILVTEQYPKGLGPTLAPVATQLPSPPIEKLDFSALDEPRVAHALVAPTRPRAVIVTGMEAHVCVFQTARDLATRGYATYVVDDAVASRKEDNRLAGLSLAERAGAIRTVTETIVFDWVRRAEGDTFKAISKLVR